MPKVAVKATLVPEVDRLDFLPKKLPGRYLAFEQRTYATLQSLSEDYHGGFWDFFELSDDGFYIAPNGDKDTYRIVVPSNGFEGRMSSDAAGIVACLFSLNWLTWKFQLELYEQYYYGLKNYACEHPEARHILGAID